MEKTLILVVTKGAARNSYDFFFKDYDVRASSPGDAIFSISDGMPDVILLESGFNAGLGIEALEEIKKSHPSIPVVFIMDDFSEAVALKALKLGARECFARPFNMFDLKDVVESLVKLRKTSYEKRAPFARTHEEARILVGATTDKPLNLLNVIGYIERNLQSDLSLETLARQANLSKYHFCRLFTRHMGVSPMKFVSKMRVEVAKSLLKKERFSVSEVAEEVGFRDASNLIKQFKKLTGLTPTGYKMQSKAGRDHG